MQLLARDTQNPDRYQLDLLWSYDVQEALMHMAASSTPAERQNTITPALEQFGFQALSHVHRNESLLNGVDLEDVFRSAPLVRLRPLMFLSQRILQFSRAMLSYEPPLLVYAGLLPREQQTHLEQSIPVAFLRDSTRFFNRDQDATLTQQVQQQFFAKTRFYVRPYVQLDLARIECFTADEQQEWLAGIRQAQQTGVLLGVRYDAHQLNFACQWLMLRMYLRHSANILEMDDQELVSTASTLAFQTD